MKNKRGLSIISVILILIFAISTLLLVYNFIIPMIQKSSNKINPNIFKDNIKLTRNSIVINDSLSALRFKIIKKGQENLSYISAIIFIRGESIKYRLIEVPSDLEEKAYILNITKPGKVEEISIYPIFQDGKIGIGQREKIDSNNLGNIEETLPVINPEKETSICISDWQCEEWSNCKLVYNLDNLIEDTIFLDGEQTRLCQDENKCNSDTIESKECEAKTTIKVNKVTEDGHEYVDVYDSEDKFISRLELIKGEYNILNINFPFS